MRKEGAGSTIVFFSVFGAIAILSFFIIRPFIGAIIGGALLAYIFHPVYLGVNKKIKNEHVASFIVAICLVLLVTVPSVLLVNHLTKQTHYVYLKSKQQIQAGHLIGSECHYEDGFVCSAVNNVNAVFQNEETKEYATDILNKFISFVTQRISAVVLSIPNIILNVFITVFITFYLLKDGERIMRRFAHMVPMKVHHQDEIHKQFSDTMYALIWGSLIVAMVQGTLAAFGYWIFGIKSFLLWGIVTTFAAFIPMVGTTMVWLPASAYLAIVGYLDSETAIIWKGFGLLLYGTFIVSSIDNVLKPVLIGSRARIHPILILVGVLGGLALFGLIGLLIGPLCLGVFQTMILIYEREHKHHKHEKQLDILGKANHGTRR